MSIKFIRMTMTAFGTMVCAVSGSSVQAGTPVGNLLPYDAYICSYEMKNPHQLYISQVIRGSFRDRSAGEMFKPIDKAFFEFVTGKQRVEDWVAMAAFANGCQPTGSPLEYADEHYERLLRNLENSGYQIVKVNFEYSGQ